MRALPKQVVSDKPDDFDSSISENTETHYGRGQHPNSKANLIPFPEGVSGNPGGRPHKYEKLKRALDKVGDDAVQIWKGMDLEKVTNRDAVIQTIWEKAKDGHMQSISLLAELGCLDPK